MSRACAACGGPLALRGLAGREARVGPVRAVADARSVASCPSCPPEVRRDGQDPLSDAIDVAIAHGLLFADRHRRGDRCGACGVELDLPMRASTRSVTVVPPDAHPFTLTFALPFVRCGGCAADNVPAELAGSVDEAARSATGVQHPGREGGRRRFSRLRRRAGRGSRALP